MKAIFLSSVLDDVTTSRTKGTTLTQWLQDCYCSDEEEPFDWEPFYLRAPRCKKSVNLIEFQFKPLPGRIPTNGSYFKKDERGNNSSETLIHLF